MTMDNIIEFVAGLGDVLVMRPQPGDGSPEIAWGDIFFYYTADGATPSSAQPFATIVTKNYPDDTASRLDRPGAFRVNIAAGTTEFARRTGRTPREAAHADIDHARDDTVLPHPTYASAGWLAVVNPGVETEAATRDLLRIAHDRARHRAARGSASGNSQSV
ncbi:hypothetical protein KO481_02980 [Nocardia sp. NEAU-G5]|uniref:DUF6194 domain-containing protein n=1 Tax=Nocardia albiluteola TaxID=2842303 RepID=A0ABS6AR35_9NOCA|nr:DUF6194 family protein [Nocardia albiluteola]MBU3060485.1 hypothetical protein [Nocardia albiluteola]